MTFSERLTEDRRAIILRALDEVSDYRLNEDSLCRVLQHFAQAAPRDLVRQDIQWLEEHRLLRLEKLPLPNGGELWIGILTQLGGEVARGRMHVGIARRGPA